MRRRLPVIVSILVVLVVGGGFAGWQWLNGTVRTFIEAWAVQQRAAGYEVEWEQLDVAGPPWRLTGYIDGGRMGRRDAGQAWSWTPPPLALDVFPLRLDEFALAADGLHRIDLVVGGRAERFFVDAAAVDARLRIGADGLLASLASRAEDIAVNLVDDPFELKAARARIAVDRVQSQGAVAGPAAATSMVASARFEDLVVPVVPTGSFGQQVALIGGEAELRGELSGGPPSLALERWRADGGTVELRRLELIWGPLSAVAEGTLALDEELQPVGALVGRVRGLTQAIDALEQAALIDARTAAFSRVAVLAFSRIPDGGGAPELQVPVTIQDRLLSLGPVPLLLLPRVAWQ